MGGRSVTPKTPESIRRTAARECAEQLAVVVSECTWDAAMTWLQDRMSDAQFSHDELILVLASMTDHEQEYRALIAERKYPTVKPA